MLLLPLCFLIRRKRMLKDLQNTGACLIPTELLCNLQSVFCKCLAQYVIVQKLYCFNPHPDCVSCMYQTASNSINHRISKSRYVICNGGCSHGTCLSNYQSPSFPNTW